eukprot:Em0003g1561a
MQTAIELGRLLRDQKVIPIKYPLPEVVVIHQDATCHDDFKTLKNYILEELNVKELTIASDEKKYGVTLTGLADSDRLGKRLKGDFKKVSQGVAAMTSQQLEEFMKAGQVAVEGHTLTLEDIKIKYGVAAAMSGQYAACADGSLMVLLNIVQDQGMVEEGVAREVVNRIQRMRKKGGLKPQDSVTVVYRAQAEGTGEEVTKAAASLEAVITKHQQYIESTTKGPIMSFSSKYDLSKPITKEEQKLNRAAELRMIKGLEGVVLSLWIVESDSQLQQPPSSTPACRFINLKGVPGSNLGTLGLLEATLLLENPVGENLLTLDQLEPETNQLLKLSVHRKLFFYHVEKGTVELVTKIPSSGETIYVSNKSVSL